MSGNGNYVAQALVRVSAPNASQMRRVRRRLQKLLPTLLVSSPGSVAVVAALHTCTGDAALDEEAEAFGLCVNTLTELLFQCIVTDLCTFFVVFFSLCYHRYVVQIASELMAADESTTTLVAWLLSRCGAGEGGSGTGAAGAKLAEALLTCGSGCRDAVVRSLLSVDDEQRTFCGCVCVFQCFMTAFIACWGSIQTLF